MQSLSFTQTIKTTQSRVNLQQKRTTTKRNHSNCVTKAVSFVSVIILSLICSINVQWFYPKLYPWIRAERYVVILCVEYYIVIRPCVILIPWEWTIVQWILVFRSRVLSSSNRAFVLARSRCLLFILIALYERERANNYFTGRGV